MHVMVLDDDAAMVRSLEIVLTGLGHEVTVFHDPVAACAHLRGGPALDVLILDYMMPALTGLEVLERIGSHLGEGCKVILVTGHCDCLTPTRLKEERVHAVLPKPLDLDRICELVGRP